MHASVWPSRDEHISRRLSRGGVFESGGKEVEPPQQGGRSQHGARRQELPQQGGRSQQGGRGAFCSVCDADSGGATRAQSAFVARGVLAVAHLSWLSMGVTEVLVCWVLWVPVPARRVGVSFVKFGTEWLVSLGRSRYCSRSRACRQAATSACHMLPNILVAVGVSIPPRRQRSQPSTPHRQLQRLTVLRNIDRRRFAVQPALAINAQTQPALP